MARALMVSGGEIEQRLGRTRELLQSSGLDALIAFSSSVDREGHVCYLSNHRIRHPNVLSHVGLGYAALVCSAEGEGVLVSPMGYAPEEVVGIDYAKTGWDMITELVAALGEQRLDDKRIGIAGMDVVPAEYYARLVAAVPRASFDDASDLLEGQRVTKSPEEVQMLREAARIADAGVKAGMTAVRQGLGHHELELVIREASLKAGAECVIRLRISSGTETSTLGTPMVSDRKLEKGDLVYVCLSGWFRNYGFNVSRVTLVGDPTEEQRDYLDHAAQATEWMIAALKPGVQTEFVYTESRGRAIVPIAHGIGLEICENPWVGLGQRPVLRPNMVLCVKPTVTSHGFGSVTISETLVVTETGVDALSQCPRVFW